MSIYSKQTSWSGQCSGSNQSPINLSQSIAKPCNLSCDFKMDDGQAISAGCMISDEGFILNGNLGSCKFRDTPYQCTALLVNHPSHHLLEGLLSHHQILLLLKYLLIHLKEIDRQTCQNQCMRLVWTAELGKDLGVHK